MFESCPVHQSWTVVLHFGRGSQAQYHWHSSWYSWVSQRPNRVVAEPARALGQQRRLMTRTTFSGLNATPLSMKFAQLTWRCLRCITCIALRTWRSEEHTSELQS